MKTQLPTRQASTLAARVAPEDLRRGDFIAVLSEIIELPSYLWIETPSHRQDEVVRLQYLPTSDRTPLKVEAICLPFVFAKYSCGRYETIDVRLASLARLKKAYAKRVWRLLRKRRSATAAARVC